jgi:DNA polymerase-3 subunit epsilon
MEIAKAADLLAQHPDFRVLRRLARTDFNSGGPEEELTAVVLDVETTGLDPELDEIIELGMIKFAFNRVGEIGRIKGEFQGMREPAAPIPKDIVELTGITDDLVAGKSLPQGDIVGFLADADLVIAHNAAFDRPFCERLIPAFQDMAWACSMCQIDWQHEGVTGTKLEYILGAFGRFYDAHRATDDCLAVLFALSRPLPRSGQGAMRVLLENARKPQVRVYAAGAPYELRLPLKRRGYRWNDGMDGFPRAWWRDVDLEEVDVEKDFLRSLTERPLIEPELFKLTARNRFRRVSA